MAATAFAALSAAFLLCTFVCRASWSGRAKDLLHPGSVHGYGRAPVCVRNYVQTVVSYSMKIIATVETHMF